MYCLLSSLTFGILLVFRASSLAQSAPYIYQDSNDDEEALIDRLATLAQLAGSSQRYSKQIYPNYDLPVPGYFGGLGEDNYFNYADREELARLPPQFGYKPDDVRYYLPAEQFPNYSNTGESSSDSLKAEDESEKQRQPKQEPVEPAGKQDIPQAPIQGQPEVEEEDAYHYMKKNQVQEVQPAEHASNIVANPSHIMASGHYADSPINRVDSMDGDSFSYSDIYYIGLIAGCSAAVVIAVVAAGIFWYRIHQRVKAAAEVDYPAYGVTGPMKSKDVSPSGGDRKLAQSAQMYHYQHQKQQMAALQKGALQGDLQGSAGSDVESEDDNEDENDYTVYECPGLAPAGEMEVKNPLFQDEATPATPHLKSEEEK